jgi:YfiH family protein
MRWRERGGVRWLEAALPGARAAFSTRLGGASAGPFESLNLGILTEDERDTVLENRRRLACALGRAADRIAIGRQVHGAEVLAHAAAQQPPHFDCPDAGPPPEVDGHHTADPGVAPLVFVADCLPVALVGPGGVAMLHCGWRGLATGIVERGATAVAATNAAVGPGIGPCCYEVGEEVLREFDGLGDGIADGPMLDLAEVARRLLERSGVGEIATAGLCTSCEGALFFSHRRDHGRTGRQAGLVWREAGG